MYLVPGTLYLFLNSSIGVQRWTLVAISYFVSLPGTLYLPWTFDIGFDSVFRISYFLSLPTPVKRIALDLHYLPCLEYFAVMGEVEEVFLFPGDYYTRQSYFNRAEILLANKVHTLSVPIQGRRPRVPLGEVRIDYGQKWALTHLRGIQSGYGKAPFFEYFFPYFEEVISRQERFLWDLNFNLLTICLKLLRRPVKVTVQHQGAIPADVVDFRGLIVPSGSFLDRPFYQEVPYGQIFGLDFVPNLSILDGLFCLGPETGSLLVKSQKKREQ